MRRYVERKTSANDRRKAVSVAWVNSALPADEAVTKATDTELYCR